MAARKIKNQPASLIGSPVAIYYDSEWQEYQVKVKGQPDATYHTNDKNDAISTAQRMRNTTAFKNPSTRKPTQSAIFKKANQLMREGYDRKQAFAIAYSEMGEPRRAKKNPAPKRKTKATTQKKAVGYVNRPSQITKAAPSKRLKKRRTVNLRSPRGVFPNPSQKKRFKHFPDAMHYAYYLALEDFQNDNEANKYYIQKAGSMYTVDSWKSGPGSVEKVIGPLDARHMINLGYSSQDFKEKFKTRLKNNPSSVHFDIDVNSHNARGAKAKTRTNPASLKTGIKVQKEKDGRWLTFAEFPKSPQGAKDAIDYAKAYHAAHPTLKIKVME